MRVVVQRVSRASVRVDGETVAATGPGLLLLAGFAPGDGPDELRWMADKVAGLRIFPDGQGRMNLDLGQAGGDVLVVSQFTLYGDATRGKRPSFVAAAPPDTAAPLFEEFLELLRRRVPGRVESGVFGALMDVEMVNHGPVTLLLER